MRPTKLLLCTLAIMAISLPAAANTMKHHGGGTGINVEGDTVEERISNLHADLKITKDEEKLWEEVAQAMRENASSMEKLAADKMKEDPDNRTAKDDLKIYQEFAQAHVDGLKNLRAAFDDLYDAMPDDQKKIADKVFHHMKPQHGKKG